MNKLRNRISTCLLLALLLATTTLSAQSKLLQELGSIPAITETKPLETTEFSEKYVTYFTQPLDHRHPEKGSFRQRVIVAHAGLTAPR